MCGCVIVSHSNRMLYVIIFEGCLMEPVWYWYRKIVGNLNEKPFGKCAPK